MDKAFQFEAFILDKTCKDLFSAESQIPVIVDAEYYDAEPEEELEAEIFLNVRDKKTNKTLTLDLSESEYNMLLDTAWAEFHNKHRDKNTNQSELNL